MSDMVNVFETNEGEDQLNTAMKMIVSAFENQSQSLNTEINRLTDQLKKSNGRVFELEAKCASLLQDKNNTETQLSSLVYQNEQLNDKLHELTMENAKLKSIKNTIIATIEKTDQIDRSGNSNNYNHISNINNINNNNHEADHRDYSPNNIKPNIKFCKPQISLTRNTKHHHSIDNILDDYTIPIDSKLFGNKKKSYVYNSSIGNHNSCSNINANNSRNLNFSNRATTIYNNNQGRRNSNSNNNNSNSNSNNHSKSNTNILNNELSSEAMMNNKNGKNGNFFKNCRKIINQGEYKEVIEIVRAFNTKKLSKQDTFIKITQILELKYPELFEEFKMLFVPNE